VFDDSTKRQLGKMKTGGLAGEREPASKEVEDGNTEEYTNKRKLHRKPETDATKDRIAPLVTYQLGSVFAKSSPGRGLAVRRAERLRSSRSEHTANGRGHAVGATKATKS